MQPKTKKPTYSIILMRDDCDVSAFRLHSFWIKLFIISIILLLAACAAGIYGTFYYQNRYRVTSLERRELQRTLVENRIRLENLANEELVGRFTASRNANRGRNGNSVMLPNSGQGSSSQSAAAPSPGASGMPTQEDLAKLLDQIGPVRSAGAASQAELEEQMANHPVKVSNLKVSFEGEDRIRLNYDLSNQQPGLTLVGRCRIALITRDGAILDVTSSARGVLSFQIARFRKMDILAQIPASIKKSDLVKVQISAKANEFPMYYMQFPIE